MTYSACHCTVVLAEVNIITEVSVNGAQESVNTKQKR